MIFVPIIVVIVFVIAFTPTGGSRRSYRRTKYKGLIGLADDMERARKRRSRNRGVFCGPGGIGHRGGKRR